MQSLYSPINLSPQFFGVSCFYVNYMNHNDHGCIRGTERHFGQIYFQNMQFQEGISYNTDWPTGCMVQCQCMPVVVAFMLYKTGRTIHGFTWKQFQILNQSISYANFLPLSMPLLICFKFSHGIVCMCLGWREQLWLFQWEYSLNPVVLGMKPRIPVCKAGASIPGSVSSAQIQ